MPRYALLGLLLTACSASSEAAPQASRWLEPSETGYAQQLEWGMPLPADFSVTGLPHEWLRAACARPDGTPASESVGGCTVVGTGKVFLRNDVSAERFEHNLLHEMGHVLSHRGGHIDCPEGEPGQYLMCPVPAMATEPMAEDFDFVLGAASGE